MDWLSLTHCDNAELAKPKLALPAYRALRVLLRLRLRCSLLAYPTMKILSLL